MSYWPSSKAQQVLSGLIRIGWTPKDRKASSHIQLVHPQRGEYTWAFHDSDEIGPRCLPESPRRPV
ncbi:MAG: type II toxin-antitoxin system HicA family toxin [Candidatus Korobacteraceae bacterium]